MVSYMKKIAIKTTSEILKSVQKDTSTQNGQVFKKRPLVICMGIESLVANLWLFFL